MARFREPPAEEVKVRAELSEHFRQAAARAVPFDRVHHPYCEPWSRLAQRLDDGEPVELAGWQVGRRVPGHNFTQVHRVIVEPDGSVTPLERLTTEVS